MDRVTAVKRRHHLAQAAHARLAEMNYDYKNRGYLLPEGCKDLIDVLKPKPQRKPITMMLPTPSAPLPPIAGELIVAEWMTIRELAALLNQKPLRIIGDLLELRVVANLDQPVSFEIIALVVRRYGYMAKKAA